jgi:hypothetical protein
MTVKYKFKTKPYSHQQTAMDLAGQRDAFGFFMEMGTRKVKSPDRQHGYVVSPGKT